jgi:putative Mg2+ transporter-C (MgtC) family protein
VPPDYTATSYEISNGRIARGLSRLMLPVELQLELSARLIVASLFGAAIGFEREVHGHAAGMRTHLLVALGAAAFTVLSIHGFGTGTVESPVDPSRVAAQIVAGIGFLGAGAIIKDGISVRGLTTAASLWATAAIGLASGTGELILALSGTGIVVFSLWPLNRIAERFHGRGKQLVRIRLTLQALDLLAEVSRQLTLNRLEIIGVQTERLPHGHYELNVDLRVRPSSNLVAALDSVGRIDGVQVDFATRED